MLNARRAFANERKVRSLKMKSERQREIVRIISSYGIETQDELILYLKDAGFDVTQATVSRDIRELKITKSLDGNGRYTYAAPKEDLENHHSAVYGDTITRSLRSVNFAGNIVVIKTYPGLANAVAAGIDSKRSEEVLGCVAGDDTIIVITKNEGCAEEFCVNMAKSAGL